MARLLDYDSWRHTPSWLVIFFNNMFFGCTGFSIVLPTVWPYLRQMGATTGFLAWVVAMYSVGEGTGGWVVGQLYSRFPDYPKLLLQVGMVLGFLAAFFYSIAPVFGDSAAPFIVLAARFLSGFDNGGRQTIEQTFIGTHVPSKYQTTISSRLSSFAITGIMLGPAFGAPLQAIHFEVPGLGLPVDGNNGPGLVLCFVCAMNILATGLFFRPAACAPQPQRPQQPEQPQQQVSGKLPEARAEELPPRPVGLFVCYLVFFSVNLSMASLETITPVVAQRLYGWGPCLDPGTCSFDVSQTYVNVLLTGGGVLSLIMSILMSCYLGSKIFGRETLSMSLGLLVLTATNMDNIDWSGSLPAWRFVGNYLLGAFFGGLLRGPTVSLLCQIIGPHPKASYMGMLFAIGAVPRVLGPFLLVACLELPTPLHEANYADVYEGPVPRTWLLYGSQGLLFLAALLLVWLGRDQVQPHPALQRSRSNLGTPLLASEANSPASVATAGAEGSWLPSTPVGMREGIKDFARMRTLSRDSF